MIDLTKAPSWSAYKTARDAAQAAWDAEGDPNSPSQGTSDLVKIAKDLHTKIREELGFIC